MKLKPDHVIVRVPDALWPSMVIAVSGENCPVEIADDGTRVVQMAPGDARTLIGASTQSNLPWRAANEALLRQLGGPPPKLEPGICIAAHLQALERMRPPHPRDLKGTLRELGVLR